MLSGLPCAVSTRCLVHMRRHYINPHCLTQLLSHARVNCYVHRCAPSPCDAPTACPREIREALDEGRPIPQRAGPHDVAATLLAFFASLPAMFMPPAAAQVCDVCVPSVSAHGCPSPPAQ